MKTARLIISAGILAGVLFSAHAYNGKNVNAKAVSCHFACVDYYVQAGASCGSTDVFSDGNLVLYTIQNAAVTSADTIYPSSQGLAHYPSFNLSGTKVAFYREDRAPMGKSGCQVANGGKNTISIVDVNTRAVTNLCDLPTSPASSRVEEVPLDWPAGDWIYYERTHDPADVWQAWSSSVDIWKVNAVTKENVKVCNFSANGQENLCTYFRRFSLSLDAKRMAVQTMPKYECTVTPNITANAVFKFPGACNLGASDRLNYEDGCNIGISASGGYVGSYLGGQHIILFINGADGLKGNGPGITEIRLHDSLELWAIERIGNGAEHIQWAVNSDKWVMQQIGYSPDGHGDANDYGSNQVVANWVDRVAINISKNHDVLDPAAGVIDNAPNKVDTIWMNNDAGDFWVSDPINNPQGTKYEDLQGVWHEAPGASVVECPFAGGRNEANPAILEGGRIRVRLSGGGPWEIIVSAADGRIMSSQRGAGPEARIATTGLGAGVYMMKISARSGDMLRRIMMR